MPLFFLILLIFIYSFGSLGAQFLIDVGVLSSPFYILSPMRPEHYLAALHGVLAFSISLIFFRFALLGAFSPKIKINLNIDSIPKKYSYYAFFIVFGLAVFFSIVQWEVIEADVMVRHSGNHNLQRIALLLSVVLIVLSLKLPLYLLVPSVLCAIYFGTIGAAASSNRSTLLPFLAAFMMFLVRKNYIFAVFFLYATIVALITAFSARGFPSFDGYWSMYWVQFLKFDLYSFMISILNPSLPGLSTLSVAYDSTQFEGRSFLDFIAYVLPAPSRLYPSGFFDDLSLSYALGIDRSVLGINFDIYSEGFYWFGRDYHWMHAIMLAFFCVVPFYILSKTIERPTGIHFAIIAMTLVYMVFGGMVFSLRAGSRPMLFICICFILAYTSKRFKLFRSKKYVVKKDDLA